MTGGVGEVSITLSDMYQAAFLMYNGLNPNYVYANGMVLFEFKGSKATELADDYLTGSPLVNASMFARSHKDIKASVRDIQQQHK